MPVAQKLHTLRLIRTPLPRASWLAPAATT